MIDLFCIASGPSLTAEDCELVRQSGAKIVAVNNSWELVPFCDYLYAGDEKWWKVYHETVADIVAEKWTCNRSAHVKYGVKLHVAGGAYNSGMRAIQFGIMKGFKNIALLGYDCSLKKGVHWHGAHTRRFLGNPNELKVGKWHVQFAKIAKKAKDFGVKIFNCSKHTELDCFEKMHLEEVLRKETVDVN